MAKYYGNIGYADFNETAPGVYTPVINEVVTQGEFIRKGARYETTQDVNDGVAFSSRVSILADDFALSNVASIQYVTWQNTKWRVTSFEIEHPRIILSLGGVYNG